MYICDWLLWRFYGHPGLRSRVLSDSPWAGPVIPKSYVLVLSLTPRPDHEPAPVNSWGSCVSGDLPGFWAHFFLYSFCSFCFFDLGITWYFGKGIPSSKLGPWELHPQLGPHQLSGKSHIILLKYHIFKLSAPLIARAHMHTHTHTRTHTHTPHKHTYFPSSHPPRQGPVEDGDPSWFHFLVLESLVWSPPNPLISVRSLPYSTLARQIWTLSSGFCCFQKQFFAYKKIKLTQQEERTIQWILIDPFTQIQ